MCTVCKWSLELEIHHRKVHERFRVLHSAHRGVDLKSLYIQGNISWLTYGLKDSPACETVSLPRPPEASYRLHSGGTPCNNLHNLLVDLSVTQFWFDGGFPDSPELSMNLNTINLALGRSSSSALRISHCDAFMSANIWCLKNIPLPFASSLTEPHFL